MKIACFDLRGTIVDHKDETRQVPLMDELMSGLQRKVWKLFVLSSYSKTDATSTISGAGIKTELNIISSVGKKDKGEVLSRLMEEERANEAIFIDDKPANLASVHNLQDNRIRVIGFIGSMKYVRGDDGSPGISTWCFRNKVELALSAVDLCETLNVPISYKRVLDMSADELTALLPGLDHPMSATEGETTNFDHRAVFVALRNKGFKGSDSIFKRLGWITCRECLLKTLVEMVVVLNGLKMEQIIGKTYKYDEYVEALKKNCPQLARNNILQHALKCIEEGIEEIGRDAERCRPKGRDINLDRVAWVTEMLSS